MYKHLSREERYQIHSLMKAKHTLTEIALLLGRDRSTISREIKRGRGQRGYLAQQACNKAQERARNSRNARRVQPWVWPEVVFYLGVEWSPEQIAGKLPVSHETVYQHVYADKSSGGKLHKGLRSQKSRRKRHQCGRDRRGQIPDRRPIGERPAHIEGRKQVGHWEGDTVIGAGHSQAVVTLVERKSGYAKIIKVANKTAGLVSQAIEIGVRVTIWRDRGQARSGEIGARSGRDREIGVRVTRDREIARSGSRDRGHGVTRSRDRGPRSGSE